MFILAIVNLAQIRQIEKEKDFISSMKNIFIYIYKKEQFFLHNQFALLRYLMTRGEIYRRCHCAGN